MVWVGLVELGPGAEEYGSLSREYRQPPAPRLAVIDSGCGLLRKCWTRKRMRRTRSSKLKMETTIVTASAYERYGLSGENRLPDWGLLVVVAEALVVEVDDGKTEAVAGDVDVLEVWAAEVRNEEVEVANSEREVGKIAPERRVVDVGSVTVWLRDLVGA